MKEEIIVIEQETTQNNNVPKAIIVHTDQSFQDIYSKSVVGMINIMLQPT